MNRQQLTVWPGQSILCQKHLIFAYFGGHESELPDFGRTWRPNGWHQVNCWGAPENFGEYRFKLAIWKVGGTKIEHSRARYIFLLWRHVNSRKSVFFGLILRTRTFSTGNFFGATAHGILTHSGFRKCSRLGWPSLCFKVIAAQSEVIAQKRVLLQKIRAVTN